MSELAELKRDVIRAVAAYGTEVGWCDSDIVGAIEDLGFDGDDFAEAGFPNIARMYFETEDGPDGEERYRREFGFDE